MHVARQSFAAAERELDLGAAAQDAQRSGSSRFSAVGLHWLRGLVRLRAGDEAGARTDFSLELSSPSAGHLYGAECAAHVHYALGVLAWRDGQTADAVAAFDQALAHASGHLMPRAGAAALKPSAAAQSDLATRLTHAGAHGLTIDAAMAGAVAALMRGDHQTSAVAVTQALEQAAPGPQGWTLPVDPLAAVHAHQAEWAAALAALRSRAA